jgi:hypothetical protein
MGIEVRDVMPTEALACSAVGTNDAWILVLGSDKVVAVATPDDDATTYIKGAVINDKQEYSMVNTTSALRSKDPVMSLKVNGRIKNDGAGKTGVKYRITDGSDTTQGVAQTGSSSWTTKSESFHFGPLGVGYWTKTILDNLKLEIELTDIDLADLTTFYVEAYYTRARRGSFLLMGVGA